MPNDTSGLGDREKLQTLIEAHRVLRHEGDMDMTSYEVAVQVAEVARKILDRIVIDSRRSSS